jgi:hypothetical protein
MNRAGLIVLFVVAILAGLFAYLRASSRPPAEENLIANFYSHRAAYERLRDMLLADRQGPTPKPFVFSCGHPAGREIPGTFKFAGRMMNPPLRFPV